MSKAAAAEFQAAEREASAIRAVLRKIGTEKSAVEEANSLTVKWAETKGTLPSSFKSLNLQLSSPIEDAQLKAFGESHTFRDVELSQATLTINETDTHDVTEITLNLLEPLKETALTTPLNSQISVNISDNNNNKNTTTLQIQTTYQPSRADIRAALYELLNTATQRKAQARDALAAAQQQQQQSAAAAVPAGFLQKKEARPPSKWAVAAAVAMEWGPRLKNYVLFGVFVVVANYRGHWLAIPAPV